MAPAGKLSGSKGTAGRPEHSEWDSWARERDTAKNLWVIATSAFWISAVVQAVVYFVRGSLNLILMSIVLGTMILGVWLKLRYQLHLRKEPPNGQDNQAGV